MSSASQPSGFDVWEDFPDDLPKIGGAQRAAAEVVAVLPKGQAETELQGNVPEPSLPSPHVHSSPAQCWAGLVPNTPRYPLPSEPPCGALRPQGQPLLVPGPSPRSLVGIIDVLLGQAGVRVLLQVVPDPVARVHVLGRAQRAQVQATAAPRGTRDERRISTKAAEAGQEKAELQPPPTASPPAPALPAKPQTQPQLAPARTFSPPGWARTAAGGRGRVCRCLKTSGHLATVKGSGGRGKRTGDKERLGIQNRDQLMQAVLSLPFLAVTHGGFKPKHLVRVDAACPRGSGMSEAAWSRAELRGLEGVNPCSSLQADPDPRGWGIRQNPGSSPARRGVGAHQRMGGTAFAHPQCHIPQRHSPGWSPLCSARICCTGQRQKMLGQGPTPPPNPSPFLNPPAPTQLLWAEWA